MKWDVSITAGFTLLSNTFLTLLCVLQIKTSLIRYEVYQLQCKPAVNVKVKGQKLDHELLSASNGD